jgi:hypothetical protein
MPLLPCRRRERRAALAWAGTDAPLSQPVDLVNTHLDEVNYFREGLREFVRVRAR